VGQFRGPLGDGDRLDHVGAVRQVVVVGLGRSPRQYGHDRPVLAELLVVGLVEDERSRRHVWDSSPGVAGTVGVPCSVHRGDRTTQFVSSASGQYI
jgi:hypothetical protein